MGKSFTSLGRYGFWTRDALLELWLDLMADEIDRNDAPEHWLHDVARRWHFAARVGFGGCVPAGLDEAASDEERRGRLRDVAVAARQRVAEDPGLLRVDELNRRNLGGDGCFFASDMEPDMVMQVADAFIALLEVRLETTARDRVVVGTRPPK